MAMVTQRCTGRGRGDVQGQLGSRARSLSTPAAGPSETGTRAGRLQGLQPGPAEEARRLRLQETERGQPRPERSGSMCVCACVRVRPRACVCKCHVRARVCKCRSWTDAPPTLHLRAPAPVGPGELSSW